MPNPPHLRSKAVAAQDLHISEVAFDGKQAQAAIGFAEAELDRRYGAGTDREGLDGASFTPPHGTFFVATVKNELCGSVGLRSIGDGVGEIKRLWVADASALMREAEHAARRFGMSLLELETGPLQPEAVALYLETGWTLVDELPYPVSDYPDAVRFLRRYDEASK